ncbi:LysM peptidoglycan-binding domain-containing protein [Methylobacterium sp. Leaf112]|uniref:LysM peptidoglycan-binding domain-containing protein n=1 Tax=Methylobacterium sp. Leaf112 TaxID=1736258 RepID=UPI0006F4E782|nr:LysM peptidoglycan-binding domain-containing protein [Methylobacterium sp. Leaf112]KQP58277.1 hypothetical protein ASF52_14360 [Methylobacterium sp. Leaf112]
MKAELRRSIFLACVGLLGGFTLVVTLYGASELFKHGFGTPEGRAVPLVTDPLAGSGEGALPVPGKPRSDRLPEPDRLPERTPAQASRDTPAATGTEASAPTFDIIRVEPSGEAVIAGRAAPNTTVELLRDNQPIARALVDPSGQFAIVPPALSPGSSEITLRSTGADGRSVVSRDSVAVVVASKRDTKPLIALTSPDRPTVVLSHPELVAPPPAAVAAGARDGARTGPKTGSDTARAEAKPEAGKVVEGKVAEGKAPESRPPETERAAGASPVKIVSVEAEEGGRLYVTSQAQPGATLRLYLNDTLVAPGSAGADGRVAFTIGRGVQPGAYTIRVDQVDPVSGKVKTRSEVAFSVPAVKPAVPRPTVKTPAATPEAAAPPARIAVLEQPLSPAAARPPGEAGPSLAATPTPAATTPDLNPGTTPDPKPEPPRTVFVPEVGTARIVRGDSLWQISRRIYGRGTRYTVIYDANQPQIRNPDRIYPGQIFVLPSDGTAAVAGTERRG